MWHSDSNIEVAEKWSFPSFSLNYPFELFGSEFLSTAESSASRTVPGT